MLGMEELDFKSFSLVLPCYRNFCSTLFLLLILVKFHAPSPPSASLDQSLLCSKSLSISWTRFSICSTSMYAYVCMLHERVSYAQDSIKALRACLSLSFCPGLRLRVCLSVQTCVLLVSITSPAKKYSSRITKTCSGNLELFWLIILIAPPHFNCPLLYLEKDDGWV